MKLFFYYFMYMLLFRCCCSGRVEVLLLCVSAVVWFWYNFSPCDPFQMFLIIYFEGTSDGSRLCIIGLLNLKKCIWNALEKEAIYVSIVGIMYIWKDAPEQFEGVWYEICSIIN